MPISELCDEHHLAPNVFYRWQKEFFENGAAAFERNNGTEVRHLKNRVEALQTKLAHKDEVIAEIMESHVALKRTAHPPEAYFCSIVLGDPSPRPPGIYRIRANGSRAKSRGTSASGPAGQMLP